MTANECDQLFEIWMQEYSAILFKVVHSFVANPHEQEDLLQEIRLALWKSIPTFSGGSKASTYIYRVSLNRAITWVNSSRFRKGRHEEYCQKATPDSEQGSGISERMEIVYAEIRGLPPEERSLILLQLEELSYREISEALGISESNVGVRLNRIRKKLADRLNGK